MVVPVDMAVGEVLMDIEAVEAEESVIIAERWVIWLETAREEDDVVVAEEEMVVLSAVDMVTLREIVGMGVAEEVEESVIRVESPAIWRGIVRMEEVEDVAVTEEDVAEGIVSAVERVDTLPEIAPTLLMSSNFIIT